MSGILRNETWDPDGSLSMLMGERRSKASRENDATLVFRMASNIGEYWRQADETTREVGADWYSWGQDLAVRVGDGDRLRGAAIVAVLSPQKPWARNVAEAVSEHREPGVVSTTWDIRSKLDRLHAGEDPNSVVGGPKVRSFWRNLAGDDEAVTVDIWALRAATHGMPTDAEYGKLASAGRYELVADAYRLAAQRAGVSPSTMQATVWIVIRGSAE